MLFCTPYFARYNDANAARDAEHWGQRTGMLETRAFGLLFGFDIFGAFFYSKKSMLTTCEHAFPICLDLALALGIERGLQGAHLAMRLDKKKCARKKENCKFFKLAKSCNCKVSKSIGLCLCVFEILEGSRKTLTKVRSQKRSNSVWSERVWSLWWRSVRKSLGYKNWVGKCTSTKNCTLHTGGTIL